jgi:hypothetical protein
MIGRIVIGGSGRNIQFQEQHIFVGRTEGEKRDVYKSVFIRRYIRKKTVGIGVRGLIELRTLMKPNPISVTLE